MGRGFARALAILNVLVKNLRLHRPSRRFFYFFSIVCELRAKARPLNFVAPVDVLWGFSKVDVLRSRRVDTRDDVRKNLHFILQVHETLFKIWSKIQYDKLSETRWVGSKGAGVVGITLHLRMGLPRGLGPGTCCRLGKSYLDFCPHRSMYGR